MAKNNRIVEDIDEAAMLQSIYERDNPPAVPPQEKPALPDTDRPERPEQIPEAKAAKETTRRKRNDNGDYSTLFLGRNELKTRSCVYISQQIHTAISEILRVVADKEITVGGYIDTILAQHLEAHKEEINELYHKELSKKSGGKILDFLMK